MSKFRSSIIPVDSAATPAEIRELAVKNPTEFVRKIQKGVDNGKLKLSDIRDIKGLYVTLHDLRVPTIISDENMGIKRTVSANAFPIMIGTMAIAAINEAYEGVPTIGQELVTEMEDNKKVTSIGQISTLDKEVDEVKELGDFPEIGASEEKIEIRHRRNGRKLTISAEAIEENNVADIVSRINQLGEIASDHIEELTLKRVTDHYGSGTSSAEPYAYRPNGTGTQLFNATANNPGTRAPSGTRITSNGLVDYTDLDNAKAVLVAMKNERGRRINLAWSNVKVLVPSNIEGIMLAIANSPMVSGLANEISNWGPQGKYSLSSDRILSSPKLDDLSTTAWYMGDFKKQFMRKWKLRFEFVSLGMDTQAYLDSRIAAQFRVAWDVEVGARDYIYVVQCLNATTAPVDE